MAVHRNSNRNQGPHHLYEIWDKEKDEVFKYGISDDPIDPEDGLSDRVRDQLYYLNLAATVRKVRKRVKRKNLIAPGSLRESGAIKFLPSNFAPPPQKAHDFAVLYRYFCISQAAVGQRSAQRPQCRHTFSSLIITRFVGSSSER